MHNSIMSTPVIEMREAERLPLTPAITDRVETKASDTGKKVRIEEVESSGNIYADLGFRYAEAVKVKAGLVMKIDAILKQRRLTQTRAAEITGIPQLSAILRGHFHNVSERKLLECLIALGQNVKIVVTPARRGREGTLTVAAWLRDRQVRTSAEA